MSIKRFYYVHSPRGTTLHRAKTRSEGQTYCGRHVTLGWKWAREAKVRIRRCTQCQKAA